MVRATVKLSAAFLHDESSITEGGGGGGVLNCNSTESSILSDFCNSRINPHVSHGCILNVTV